jgi:hypothetical protein
VAALLVCERPIEGLIEQPTDRDFASALNMASSSETLRAHFHGPYIVPMKDELVEQLEVITEYRRLVLAAEEQLQAGNWMLGRGGFDQKGRTLKDLQQAFAGQVSIRARLRFHPHNSFVMLPPFDILLGEPTLVARQSIRTPHIIPASGDGKTRDFIAGATIEMAFDAHEIGDRALPVRIVSAGKEVARVVVDFARFD